jgi:polysaccharide deacetylase family protein (PEP-CTERM system associated)
MTNDRASAQSSREAINASGVLRNALSVDVEDYFHVSALAGTIRRADWDQMEYRAEQSTRTLLKLFDEFDAQATFFVLGWIAKRSPGLVREIHDAGHEVACHGMSHELIYNQTTAAFADETRASKELLEDIIAAPVVGYRAASWSITPKSLWALDIISDLGFQYDSSIFPIRHDRYGIPGATQKPGLIDCPNGNQLVEFPPSTVSISALRLPVAGGGYFRLLPYWVTRFGLRKLNRQLNQPFIFYLHPWEVDPQQPRIDAPWISRFRHYTNLDKTELRLRRLLSEFKCTSALNVLKDIKLLT